MPGKQAGWVESSLEAALIPFSGPHAGSAQAKSARQGAFNLLLNLHPQLLQLSCVVFLQRQVRR